MSGVFLHMKTPPLTLDKFTRFYEVRFYPLLTDYTKQYACLFIRNHDIISVRPLNDSPIGGVPVISEEFSTRLAGVWQSLKALHKGGAGMSSASSGREREQFVDEFLRKVLPPAYPIGSGDVIDSFGGKTGQQDVVVEFSFPPDFASHCREGANVPCRRCRRIGGGQIQLGE